jgi:tRNA (cmo5U34)-methyltransferase
MAIEHAFNASVEYYDDWMMKALPNYHDIFQTAKELVFFDPTKPIEVIDLGAGTGLFSKHILDKFPKANFLLYDLATQMLDVAKRRFAAFPQQFSYHVGDYCNIDTSRDFDLVISSLSIHHLTDADKCHLFQSIYRLLKNPGLFINIDQIRGNTPYLQQLYWNHWLTQVRQKGQPETRIQESIERRQYDKDALLSEQLEWLTQAGFSNVDCVYKNFFVGVFFAMKQ